jgi:hypothetical protein
MWIWVIEALAIGGLFTFIVWWTKFSGRNGDAPASDACEQASVPPGQRH